MRVQFIGGPELAAVMKKVGKNGPMLMGSALTVEAEKIMTASKQKYVPVDTGINLRAHGYVKSPRMQGRLVEVLMGYGGPAQKYALFIHEGTGPAVGRPAFHPPSKAFKGWVHRHGMPESMAYVIARAVGKRGLKPRKYLERPLLEAIPGMAQRMAKLIAYRLALLKGQLG